MMDPTSLCFVGADVGTAASAAGYGAHMATRKHGLQKARFWALPRATPALFGGT
ncbi:MAG: hypothetical protein H7338_07675, partial [Candidatus Sericytochromatia bacterium]|nr:hypothetical protein [Candidatus Sericytochromatia bacterium]